jgi:hypothetical protein
MTLKVHIYDDRLECYVGGDHVITLQRLRRNKKRLHHIDYRHIVGSLVRKPQAFRSYIYKDDLFPTFAFRQIWELMDKQLDSRLACREFVKILNEAARPGGQGKVNNYLEDCLVRGVLPTSHEAKALFKNCEIVLPALKMNRAEPSDYDSLLRNTQGGIL